MRHSRTLLVVIGWIAVSWLTAHTFVDALEPWETQKAALIGVVSAVIYVYAVLLILDLTPRTLKRWWGRAAPGWLVFTVNGREVRRVRIAEVWQDIEQMRDRIADDHGVPPSFIGARIVDEGDTPRTTARNDLSETTKTPEEALDALLLIPVRDGGVLLRIVLRGDRVISEIWRGPSIGWVEGGDLSSAFKSLPASERTLREFGVPEEDWVSWKPRR